MRLFHFAVLFLLINTLYPEFIIGKLDGGKVAVLCENQRWISVAAPSGRAVTVPTGENWEAAYFPTEPGLHSVVCGEETGTFIVPQNAESPLAKQSGGADGWLSFAAAIVAGAAFLSLVALAAKHLVFSRTIFTKEVRENSARLYLRAGGQLKNISIRDPTGCGTVKISRLSKGEEWSFECELQGSSGQQPALLEAQSGSGKISLASHFAGGKKSEGSPVAPKVMRKLARAGQG